MLMHGAYNTDARRSTITSTALQGLPVLFYFYSVCCFVLSPFDRQRLVRLYHHFVLSQLVPLSPCG